MIDRVKSLLHRRTPPSSSAVAAPEASQTLVEAIAAAGESPVAWLAARRAGGRLYADIPDASVRRMLARFGAHVERTINASERILRHEFDVLGSGPFVAADPARPPRDGYAPIDWYLDPIRNLRFQERVPYRDWNLMTMRPGTADVKLPWELARCQHWVTLGQAYRLTADERFAGEIVNEHVDFIEANPVGFGIHWTCTMDVAIRAFNWALAAELIRRSRALDDRALARLYGSLWDHATFIEANLENRYEVTSNHFLSNVVGLYGLGLVFQDLAAGARWRQSCRGWLENEMRVQVLADGADYESSIPYHRLVTELFLSGALLAKLEGHSLSAGSLERLRLMVDFLRATLRPDGLLPQVGDADDGRLHIFTDYGTWNPQDARHLFAPSAIILDRPQWLAESGDDGLWEAGWWGCDIDAAPAAPMSIAATKLFEDAGVAVVRTPDAYLLVTNGRVGTNGFGNHKHNDLLGFEFHAAGTPIIVDPGSYVYTSDPDARNLFRSTAYHNTLRVDGVEQNDLKPEFLFRLFETSAVAHLGFEDNPAFAQYRGRHTGYERLPSPVTHDRSFRLVKASRALQIVDSLRGAGRHHLAWHFHLAPGVAVDPRGGNEFAFTVAALRFWLRAPADLEASVTDAWYSPSYGVRVPCRALDFASHALLDGGRSWSFSLAPQTGI